MGKKIIKANDANSKQQRHSARDATRKSKPAEGTVAAPNQPQNKAQIESDADSETDRVNKRSKGNTKNVKLAQIESDTEGETDRVNKRSSGNTKNVKLAQIDRVNKRSRGNTTTVKLV